MIDDKEYGLPKNEKASLVSIVSASMPGHKNDLQTGASLRELRELLRTLQIETGEDYIQKKADIEAGTILGKGKLQEIAESAKEEGSTILVFDFELTASQIRNISKITELEVVDRCTVILEIFARHARTKEAMIQIEMARLSYLLPRLTRFWSHLGRQRGGVGVRGGEGEQQLELDRRIIRQRIEGYKKQLKGLDKSRTEQRKRRQNQAVTAALVGYTNAGKSSLMNRLCQVEILEEDKLFATLDATFRTLNPDTKPPMILIDTVGFISNLPNTLIEGFKTTLESALEAHLLIIVVDVSDPEFEKHIEVTHQVLEELNIKDKEIILVFNKRDKLTNKFSTRIKLHKYKKHFLVSSFNESDIRELREYIINYFLDKQLPLDLFVPYEEGEAHAQVRAKTNILKEKTHEKGIYYRVRVPDFIYHGLTLDKFKLANEIQWDQI